MDALKNLDMQMAPGEVVGLIGSSGSGKSTFLKCLGAVIEPTAGRILLGEEAIYDDGWRVKDIHALRSSRPYKPAYDHDTACKILLEGDGRTMPGHFDPQVHEAFLDLRHNFAEIFEMSRKE